MVGMDIEDISKKKFKKPKPTKRHDGHTEVLENKVDALEAEILVLKKQLKLAKKIPSNTVTKEQYDDVLRQLKEYWDAEIPF